MQYCTEFGEGILRLVSCQRLDETGALMVYLGKMDDVFSVNEFAAAHGREHAKVNKEVDEEEAEREDRGKCEHHGHEEEAWREFRRKREKIHREPCY